MDVFNGGGIFTRKLRGQVYVNIFEIQNYGVRKGDVFFTRTSETVDEIGLAAVFLDDTKNVVFSGFVLRARPLNNLLNNEFKKYCFLNALIRKQIMSSASYTTRALTNGNLLGKVKIALPPLEEQEQISFTLSSVDTQIQKLDQLISKKEAIKTATMQLLLTGKKRLPGFSANWMRISLGDVLKIKHGKSQKDIEVVDGKYPILATGGIIGRTNSFLHSSPSVLIGRKGTINRPQFMDSPFWTVDTLFYSEIKNNTSAKFIFYIFNLIDWMKYNEASGVPSLSAKIIENIEIKIPSIKEQLEIENVIDSISDEILLLKQKKKKITDIKKGMMQQLLTGRTRLV